MSSARIDSAGKVTTLDGKAEPDEVITEADVQDPAKLARRLGAMAKDLAMLRRAWAPRRLDFDEQTITAAGNTISLEHGFGGRVRWWVVSSTTESLAGENATLTTANTLVLNASSLVDGTCTIRVEEAG